MIDWHDIDTRLDGVGKDRSWLAAQTGYSEGHIRTVLAPGSLRRTERIQLILSKAIEDEEDAVLQRRELPPGVHELWLTADQLDRADRAARLVDAPSLVAFCRDSIQLRAREILEGREGREGKGKGRHHAVGLPESVSPHASVRGAMAG